MAISSVSNAAGAVQTNTYTSTPKTENTAEKKTETAKNNTTGAAAVYEKSSDKQTSTGSVTKKPNTALVAKLKADAEQRTAQLKSLVEKMMTKQGAAIGKADSMWRFLANGNFTVDAATKAQAQADIAEDGYWGVEQTSDRILDFAKALSGNDPDKADELLEAFKKGFKQATGAWGKDLPDISQRTYDAVVEKFENWKKGSKTEETVDPTQTQA